MSELIIVCPTCGTKNRIPNLRLGRPKCGRCGKVFDNALMERRASGSAPQPPAKTDPWVSVLAAAIILLAVSLGGGAAIWLIKGQSSSPSRRGVTASDLDPCLSWRTGC